MTPDPRPGTLAARVLTRVHQGDRTLPTDADLAAPLEDRLTAIRALLDHGGEATRLPAGVLLQSIRGEGRAWPVALRPTLGVSEDTARRLMNAARLPALREAVERGEMTGTQALTLSTLGGGRSGHRADIEAQDALIRAFLRTPQTLRSARGVRTGLPLTLSVTDLQAAVKAANDTRRPPPAPAPEPSPAPLPPSPAQVLDDTLTRAVVALRRPDAAVSFLTAHADLPAAEPGAPLPLTPEGALRALEAFILTLGESLDELRAGRLEADLDPRMLTRTLARAALHATDPTAPGA